MMRSITVIAVLFLSGLGMNAAHASEAGVSVTFTDSELQLISAWYRDHDDSSKKHKSGKGQKSGLPPGIEKNLARGKSMPPGIAKQQLPSDLRRSLPAPPDGYERIIAGGKILLVEVATQVIHDVLTDVIAD